MNIFSNFKSSVYILFAALSLASMYYIGYLTARPLPGSNPTMITLQDAQRITARYKNSSPSSYTGVVSALVLDIDQYNAMGEILKKAEGISAFRIYYGIDDNGRPVRIVAGIGISGHDNTNVLELSQSNLSGLCPPTCDAPGGVLGQ